MRRQGTITRQQVWLVVTTNGLLWAATIVAAIGGAQPRQLLLFALVSLIATAGTAAIYWARRRGF